MSEEELRKQLEEIVVEQHNEIERLTELCNKYEEEHKTTFETWQKDIKENELLHSIIKEAKEYMNNLRWFEMFTKEHDITLYASTKDFYRDIKEILDKEGK